MNRVVHILTFVAVAMLSFFVPAGHAADDLDQRNPDRIWKLTSYLHGTTAEVRDQLNSELERQMDKRADGEKTVRTLKVQLYLKNQEAVEFCHTRAEYLKLTKDRDALAAERDDLQEQLAKARATGTSSTERLDLSARYNRVRLGAEKAALAARKMEQDAHITYIECIDLRATLKEAEGSLQRTIVAFDQSEKWRNSLLNAMRNSFNIEGPLRVGSQGLIGHATCEKITGKDSLLISASVPWGPGDDEGDKEGITTVHVRLRKVYIGISGIETVNMKEGAPVTIEQTIRIFDLKLGSDLDLLYLGKHVGSDVEDLIATVTPLLPK